MKKITALLLMLLMLLSALPALGEGALYLRQEPQDAYTDVALISLESYPQVCIAPYENDVEAFFGKDAQEALFLCFPGPDGAQPDSFDTQYAHYLDVEYGIQYGYYIEMFTWDEFLSTAPREDGILLDGSDGTAVYVDPESLTVIGAIPAEELGQDAKLVIVLSIDSLTPGQTSRNSTVLADAINEEIDRVKAEMHVERCSPFWNNGEYAGAELLELENFSFRLSAGFPETTLQYGDGREDTVAMTVLGMFDSTVYGVYDFGDGNFAEVVLSLNTESVAASMYAQNDEDAFAVTLSSGRTWYIYLPGLGEYGLTNLVYAAVPLGKKDGQGNEYYYLVRELGYSLGWNGLDSFVEDAELFDACIEVIGASQDKTPDSPFYREDKRAR